MGKVLRYVGWAVALGLVLLAGQARHQRLRTARAEELFRAIQAERPDMVAELLEQGTRPDVTDEFGTPALCRAAECSDPTLVKLFLRAGVSVDQRDADDGTALMRAVTAGQPEVVRELLAAGADVNATSHRGWTSLHDAANQDRSEVIPILVNAGARVSPRRKDGATPLRLALKHGFGGTALVLLQAGAEVDPQDRPAVSQLLSSLARPSRPVQDPSWDHSSTVRVSITQAAVPRRRGRQAGPSHSAPRRVTHIPRVPQDPGAEPKVLAAE